VKNSVALDNASTGIEASGLVTDCVAIGNGVGMTGALRMISNYPNPPTIVSSGGSFERCLAMRNKEDGFKWVLSALSSVAIHNGQHGMNIAPSGVLVSNKTILRNDWIIGNQVDGAGNASNCSIENCLAEGNGGIGIRGLGWLEPSNGCGLLNSIIRDNLGGGARTVDSMSGCNIYGNGGSSGLDYREERPSTVLAQVNLRGNYWGPATTTLMDQHPWGSYFDIPAIHDFVDDTTLCEIKYDPHLTIESLTAMPDDSAPGFLLTVSPTLAEPLNAGAGVFRLTFSKPMNTAVPLAVTFGAQAPYTSHIVAPAPGWVDAKTWQGLYTVQSRADDGIHTLRVSGAVDTTGFALPDDMEHPFRIEASGSLPANNGLAIGQGTKISLSWSEQGKPASALGYNIQRSTTGLPGSYQKVNASILTAPNFTDWGVAPNTLYFYIVYLVNSDQQTVQWTAPFAGRSGTPVKNSAREWGLYE
jgi:hypothetical protein